MRFSSSTSANALLATALLVLVTTLTGCTSDSSNPPYTLRVLGGSELEDMRPVLDKAAQVTGVTVELTEQGTLDSTQEVVSGRAAGSYDAIWFPSNRYLAAHPGGRARLGTSTKIMSSPVLLGLRHSTAQQLGWDRSPVSWATIAEAAGQRKFTFGMTNPAESNSGFSALVGIATAVTNTGAALDTQQITRAAPQLRDFFSAQTLSSGSSGWLSDSYQKRDSFADPDQRIDGLVNYESVLLSLNAAGTLREPLTVVYPSDGVVTADYPLTLLGPASDAAKAAYRELVDYLRAPAVQREIMDRTHRRPITTDVPLPEELFGKRQLYELPFPATLDEVNELIGAYFDTLRRPPRTIYVLDTSGSMAGERIAELKAALAALTGADHSLAGQFHRFHNREQVTLLPFSGTPDHPAHFEVPEQDPQPVLDQIRAHSDRLTAGGETGIYDALLTAYDVLAGQAANDPDRISSIVLMTDGENNKGRDLAAFIDAHHRLPPSVATVPVFPVLFGEGNVTEMQQLAQLTGGLTFDARPQSLTAVFSKIRGYQ